MTKDKADALAAAAAEGIRMAHAWLEYQDRRRDFLAAVDEVGRVNIREGLVPAP